MPWRRIASDPAITPSTAAVVAAGVIVARLDVNQYYYFAAYVVLQYVILATAWNILGGYTGYVNFGTPAFFALGVYTSCSSSAPPTPRSWCRSRPAASWPDSSDWGSDT